MGIPVLSVQGLWMTSVYINLNVRYTKFDHFLYIAFKETTFLENFNDGADSGKYIRLVFFYYFIKTSGIGLIARSGAKKYETFSKYGML